LTVKESYKDGYGLKDVSFAIFFLLLSIDEVITRRTMSKMKTHILKIRSYSTIFSYAETWFVAMTTYYIMGIDKLVVIECILVLV